MLKQISVDGVESMRDYLHLRDELHIFVTANGEVEKPDA
jgi:hypothetical protein